MVTDADKMPGAHWFPESRLNLAQNLLRRGDRGDAFVFWDETGFKRRVSYHTNLLRFAPKCLSPATSSRLMVQLAAPAAVHLTRRNVKIALAIALALARNAAPLSGTWAARRVVRRTPRLTHEALLRRFAPQERHT